MLVLPFAKDKFVEIRDSESKQLIWVLFVNDLKPETGDTDWHISETLEVDESPLDHVDMKVSEGWQACGTKLKLSRDGKDLVIHVLPPERQSGRVRIGFEDASFNYIINRPGYSKQRPKTAV